ncbi:MAG: hypothetical protein DMG40_23925 [Acidobacteria bacterium]|nr:MAG: hypothetical protein DMG40_23925 [Acidobacteriota bacterium]
MRSRQFDSSALVTARTFRRKIIAAYTRTTPNGNFGPEWIDGLEPHASDLAFGEEVIPRKRLLAERGIF